MSSTRSAVSGLAKPPRQSGSRLPAPPPRRTSTVTPPPPPPSPAGFTPPAAPSTRAPKPRKAASGGKGPEGRMQSVSLSLPVEMCSAWRARVKRDDSTLADVLMDALVATQDDLSVLVGELRAKPRSDGLFVRKERKPSEDLSTVPFKMATGNLEVVDNLQQDVGAESRSQLCRAALGAYLDVS